jgi:sugar lactone lactonase YvrE
MYYIDSLSGGVDVYVFDLPSGEISDRRRFVDIPLEHGEPDGLTVDETGCVWFAIWRAGEVRRYTPAGELDTIVGVPASHSTSCCFGGPALDTLFITSARCDLTAEQLDAQPHAGAVFACQPGVTGLPSTPFAAAID